MALVRPDARATLGRCLVPSSAVAGDDRQEVLALTVSWVPDRGPYTVTVLTGEGALVSAPVPEETGAMLHAVLWCKTPVDACADEALAARLREESDRRAAAESAAREYQEQVRALREVDRSLGAERQAHDATRAEAARLRSEVARLRAENDRLRAQGAAGRLAVVRAALDPAPPVELPTESGSRFALLEIE